MRLTKYFGWGLGLAGLIIAVWLLGRGQPEEPGQLTITSDYPAEVIVSQDTPRSLGTTPATLKIDQVGYWEIAGFEPIEGQRQLAYRLLRPGEEQEVSFGFAASWRPADPEPAYFGSVRDPRLDLEGLAGRDQASGDLRRLRAIDTNERPLGFVDQPRARQVVWSPDQAYLYLTHDGRLGSANGWEMPGVEAVAGNRGGAAWVTAGSQVELFDWATQTRQSLGRPDSASIVGLELGERYLYLLVEAGHPEAGVESNHPHGQILVEVYGLDSQQLVSTFEITSRPRAFAELDGYSAWLTLDSLQIIDNPTGEILAGTDHGQRIVDLTSGLGPDGQSLLYELTDAGEIWDFDADRGTHNLIGRAPRLDGSSRGQAVAGSLVQAGGRVYFGWRVGAETGDYWRTLAVELTTADR